MDMFYIVGGGRGTEKTVDFKSLISVIEENKELKKE